MLPTPKLMIITNMDLKVSIYVNKKAKFYYKTQVFCESFIKYI